VSKAANPRTCPRCKTSFVMIVPRLELCDCSSRGEMAIMKGAEAEARELVEKRGGLDVIRRALANEKALRKDADIAAHIDGRSELARRRKSREIA